MTSPGLVATLAVVCLLMSMSVAAIDFPCHTFDEATCANYPTQCLYAYGACNYLNTCLNSPNREDAVRCAQTVDVNTFWDGTANINPKCVPYPSGTVIPQTSVTIYCGPQCVLLTSESQCLALYAPQTCEWTGTSTCRSKCSTFLTSSDCTVHSDCTYNAGVCSLNVPPPPSTCAAATPQTQCVSDGCFFDLWTNQCYTTVSIPSSLYPCAQWTDPAFSYSSPAAACEVHGCEMLGESCVTPTALNVTTDVIYHSNGAIWSDPYFVPNSETFGFTISVPFGSAYNNPPFWYRLRIGDFSTDPAYAHCYTSQSTLYPTTFTWPSADISKLNYDAALWIDTYKNFDFSSFPGTLSGATTPTVVNGVTLNGPFENGAAYKTALMSNYGPSNIGPVYTFKEVTRSTDGEMVRYKIETTWNAIKTCLGVVEDVGNPDSTLLTLPTFVDKLSVDQGETTASHSLFLTRTNTGGMTISPNSRYQSHVFIKEAHVGQDSCGVGSGKLFITYEGVFYGVSDPLKVIGPRDITDLSFRPTPDLAPGTPLSQYFDTFQSFVAPTCSSMTYSCFFRVTSVTPCRVLVPDGSAFNNFAHADNARRLVEYPTSSPFDASFNGKHNWFMNVRSCDTTGTTCELINSAPSGVPDFIPVTLFLDAYPPNDFSLKHEVAMGLLPTTLSTDKSEIVILATQPAEIPGTGVQLKQLPEVSESERIRNLQLTWRKSINPIVRVVDEFLTTMEAQFSIEEMDMKFTALDTSGSPVLGLDSSPLQLTYSQLFPLMTYVPKSSMAGCSGCTVMPILTTTDGHSRWIGMDAYSIPVLNLMNAFPLPFTGLNIENRYILKGVTDPVPLGRRLLTVNSPNGPYEIIIVYNADGTVSSSYNVFIDREGMPGFNPSLTYFNATANETVTVRLEPKPMVLLPAVMDVAPAGSARSLAVVIVTVLLVDFVLFVTTFVLVQERSARKTVA